MRGCAQKICGQVGGGQGRSCARTSVYAKALVQHTCTLPGQVRNSARLTEHNVVSFAQWGKVSDDYRF